MSFVHFSGEDVVYDDADLVDVEDDPVRPLSLHTTTLDASPPPAYSVVKSTRAPEYSKTRGEERITTRLRRDMFIEDVLSVAGLHMGLPYGPGVRAMTWKDADIAGGSMSKHDINELGSMFTRFFATGAKSLRKVVRDGASVVVEISEGEFDVTGASGGERCGVISVDGTVLIAAFYAGEGEDVAVIDVVLSTYCEYIVELDETQRRQLVSLLAAMQVALVADNLFDDFTLLQESGLKAIKACTRRDEHTVFVRDRDAARSVACAAVLTSASSVLEEKADIRVDVAYSHGTVAHGTMNAWDVPPSMVVLLGSNGGKSITGSVMVVRSQKTTNVYLYTTSCTAGVTIDRLQAEHKMPPMVRDGLLSPLCCAAMHAVGDGNVRVKVGDTVIDQPTIWSSYETSSEVTEKYIVTRDVESTIRGLYDIAMLNRMEPQIRQNSVCTESCKVTVLYGPTTGPRWLNLLEGVDYTPNELSMSEHFMDHGCSGLGRFMLRKYLKHGRLYNCNRLTLPRKGYFSEFRKEAILKKDALSTSRVQQTTDYVVDFEYYTFKRGDKSYSAPYAVGLAKFSGGAYVSSYAAMVPEIELANARASGRMTRRTGEEAALLAATNIRRTRLDSILELISALQGQEGVRMYAKGRDNDAMFTEGVYHSDIEAYSRKEQGGTFLRELGAFSPRVEALARMKNYSTVHNPAKECVLFAMEVGICCEDVAEDLVGEDNWPALRFLLARPTV